MPSSRLMVGDTAIDLVEKGKVQVVERAADSVAEHQEQNQDYDIQTYKSHPLLEVSLDEPVYTCVYLPDKPTVSFSGTYDFPASRLARCPVEEANQALRRPSHTMIVDTLTALFGAVEDIENVTFWAVNDVALEAGIPEDLVSEARELAEVEAQFEDGDGDE